MNLGYDWPVTQFPSLLQHSSCLDLHFPQLILNSHIWQLWMFRKSTNLIFFLQFLSFIYSNHGDKQNCMKSIKVVWEYICGAAI